jgi:hypothetical protein
MDAPRWMRDLSRFLPLKSHFVLSGNVRDRYPLILGDGPPHLMPLVEYLAAQLTKAGIERAIAYDPVHGFRVPAAFNRDSTRHSSKHSASNSTIVAAPASPMSVSSKLSPSLWRTRLSLSL